MKPTSLSLRVLNVQLLSLNPVTTDFIFQLATVSGNCGLLPCMFVTVVLVEMIQIMVSVTRLVTPLLKNTDQLTALSIILTGKKVST